MNHQLHDNVDWFACGTDSDQLNDIWMRQQFHVISLTEKFNLGRKKKKTTTKTLVFRVRLMLRGSVSIHY